MAVTALTGVALGVSATASSMTGAPLMTFSAATGDPAAEVTPTVVGPFPAGASVTRSGVPVGYALAQVQGREQAVARKRASRSAARAALAAADPHQIARTMMSSRYGWGASEYSCLSLLWQHESGWQVSANNPSSDAYGIPQALPGSKMSTYGGDWRTNPVTQIAWGLAYITSSYGTPCAAWGRWQGQGWY